MQRVMWVNTLAEVSAQEWDALVPERNPFLSHAFLSALERHQCVGVAAGWLPQHMLCRDAGGQLVGAAPMYLKNHSEGEFICDLRFAAMHQQSGTQYYPKIISAIPFTPITSARLFCAPECRIDEMIVGVLDAARNTHCASVHWLFPARADVETLVPHGFLPRIGFQFHWQNRDYRDFQDFLDTLTTKRRKTIIRERRRVQEAGFTFTICSGHTLNAAQWQCVFKNYVDTFTRYGNTPPLTLPFFEEMRHTLGDQLVVILALERDRIVASAICFRSNSTLYGRYWGCQHHHDSLHFEACYYQGIDYCIQHGLTRFEPGAGGDHKFYRGFLPTVTYSAHWIGHPHVSAAIKSYLVQEAAAVHQYIQQLLQHSPYREAITDDVAALVRLL